MDGCTAHSNLKYYVCICTMRTYVILAWYVESVQYSVSEHELQAKPLHRHQGKEGKGRKRGWQTQGGSKGEGGRMGGGGRGEEEEWEVGVGGRREGWSKKRWGRREQIKAPTL